MKSRLLTLMLVLASIAFVQAQDRLEFTIYFGKNTDKLDDGSKNVLTGMVEALKAAIFYKIQITAYAATGTGESNPTALAQNRALSVNNFLVKQGNLQTSLIDFGTVSVDNPAGTNAPENILKNYRRVIVSATLYTEESQLEPGMVDLRNNKAAANPPVEDPNPSAKPVEVQAAAVADLTTLRSKLLPEIQSFTINSQRDTFIVGERGTIVYIPAYSFRCAASKWITVNMHEVHDFSDMFRHGITTHYKGDMLQSGGMVYTEAFCEKNAVRPIEPLTIAIPTKTLDFGMSVYYNNGSYANWTPIRPAPALAADKLAEAIYYIVNEKEECNCKGEGLVFKKIYPSGVEHTVRLTDPELTADDKKRLTDECKAACKLQEERHSERLRGHNQLKTWTQTAAMRKGDMDEIRNLLSSKPAFAGAKVDDLNYYVFENREMGWRNIDRPYTNEAEPPTTLTVTTSPEANKQVFVAFTDINTMLQLTPRNDGYALDKMPGKHNVKIIALKYNAEGKPELAIKATTTNQGVKESELAYTCYQTTEELLAALKAIN